MKSKINRFNIDFPAHNNSIKRKAYVYLPYGYNNNKKYPVLYCFDGHNVFYDKDATYGKSWGMREYLDKHKIELIVVAVECNTGDDGLGRMLEYSPYPMKYFKGKTVYGDKTIKWFINKLKPLIDNNYSTLSDRNNTFILGSSMGGLMSTYALIKYNRVFSKAAALSPAYVMNRDYMFKDFENAKIKKGTELYMDYGTKDLDWIKSHKEIDRMYKILSIKGVNITYRCVYNGEHNEASWEKQLPFVINMFMSK